MTPTTYEELYKAVDQNEIVAAIRKDGTKHRLFVATNGNLCFFKPRSSRRGYAIYSQDFENYVKFIGKAESKSEADNLKKQYNVIAKYKKLASQSTLSNSWIEDCKKLPDFETWKNDVITEQYGSPCEPKQKSLYEFGITTGNKIDGKVISLSRIAKEYPYAIEQLREGIKNKKAVGTVLYGRRFAGYDISISLEQKETGELFGYLSLEYKGCGNGYYYLLINDENFIGYDVD
jgi:hypothetical protein